MKKKRMSAPLTVAAASGFGFQPLQRFSARFYASEDTAQL
jgi:hypothetical protein